MQEVFSIEATVLGMEFKCLCGVLYIIFLFYHSTQAPTSEISTMSPGVCQTIDVHVSSIALMYNRLRNGLFSNSFQVKDDPSTDAWPGVHLIENESSRAACAALTGWKSTAMENVKAKGRNRTDYTGQIRPSSEQW